MCKKLGAATQFFRFSVSTPSSLSNEKIPGKEKLLFSLPIKSGLTLPTALRSASSLRFSLRGTHAHRPSCQARCWNSLPMAMVLLGPSSSNDSRRSPSPPPTLPKSTHEGSRERGGGTDDTRTHHHFLRMANTQQLFLSTHQKAEASNFLFCPIDPYSPRSYLQKRNYDTHMRRAARGKQIIESPIFIRTTASLWFPYNTLLTQ